MNLVNPFWNAAAPGPHYLLEDFNGPSLNADWTGAGGTYTFAAGQIELTAGLIQSVRNDLDFSFGSEIIIHHDYNAGEWFLVVGDISGGVYSIQVRFVPSIGRVRLTQHYGGADHHQDWFYGALSDTEWLRLEYDAGSGWFILHSSTDGITFSGSRAIHIPDISFDVNNVGVAIANFSGTVKMDFFDSNILA